MHRAQLTLQALALTGLCLSGAATALAPLGDDLGKLSEEQLLDRVRQYRNTVDRKIFEELGRRRSKASYEALVDATSLVTGQWPLRYAYQAFAQFKDSEDLGEAQEGRRVLDAKSVGELVEIDVIVILAHVGMLANDLPYAFAEGLDSFGRRVVGD